MSAAMASRSLLSKACSLINSQPKFAYKNGIIPANLLVPCMGLKTKSPTEIQEIPEKPKKPLTSYFRYLVETRPLVVKEDPSLDHKSIVKTIGERWKALAPELKAKYEIEFTKAREQYDKDVLSYNEKLTPEQEEIIEQLKADKKSEKKKRKIRQENKCENKPKRPLNSFTLFIKDNPQVTGEKSMIENVKQLKEKWAKLSEVEKEKYRMITQRNMEQYEIEMAKWEAQMIAEGKSHLARAKTLKGKKGKIE